MSLTILNYKFSIHGTQIIYQQERTVTVLSFDPAASCELLQELGAIEDFVLDNHGDPVILYTYPYSAYGYGFDHWCDFVKHFPFTRRTAEIILEDRARAASHKAFQATVINLLSPLTAA